MDSQIGVGILIALTFGSTTYILNSDYFSKNQKIILGILFVFPPAQWVLSVIIGIWNKQNDSTIGFKIDSAKRNKSELNKLRDIGVLSEEEYVEKTQKILDLKLNELFLKSEEYKSLKKLKNSGILTEEEFLKKSKKLQKRINKKTQLDPNSLVGIWSNENIIVHFYKDYSVKYYVDSNNPSNVIKGIWNLKEQKIVLKLGEYSSQFKILSLTKKRMIYKTKKVTIKLNKIE
jgi:hypothetical protein